MTQSDATRPRRLTRPREVFAWAMYDWANSAYSTLYITFLVAYVSTVVWPGIPGSTAYAYIIGTSTFFAAILSPTIGAIADVYANKRAFLTYTVATGATAATLMGLVPSDARWLVLALFFIAHLHYEVSWSVYNGFLPEIANDDEVDRVSGYAFALGYIGGGVALLVAILVMRFGGRLGFPDVQPRSDRAEFRALAIDYCATNDGQFAVAVADGLYRVEALLGDATGACEGTLLSLGSDVFEDVSTEHGEFVEIEREVEVRDGTLRVRLKSRNPDESPAVLNALRVTGRDNDVDLRFDFGTPFSDAAPGWIWVAPRDKYDTFRLAEDKRLSDLGIDAATFGWQSGEVTSRDIVVPPRLRFGLVLMGLWWGGFSIPTLLVLRDRRQPSANPAPPHRAAIEGLRQVGRTLRNIRLYRTLFLFLLAYLLYNEGVQTVISQASVFATNALSMGTGELAAVVLMIQFVAMPGTMIVTWLSQRIGQKPTVILCLIGWICLLLAAFFVTTTGQFWGMAIALAFIMGGTQTVSRAIMGVMTPKRQSAEFFGFFNFSGRATSMLGPFFFGTVYLFTESAHLAIVSLLIFFGLGLLVVSLVNVQRGKNEALEAHEVIA